MYQPPLELIIIILASTLCFILASTLCLKRREAPASPATVTISMFPRGLLCAVILALAGSAMAQQATIVAVVTTSTDHTTLEALVTRAGLIPALQGAGKFTLFAPNDASFAALGTTSTLVLKINSNPISDLWKPLLQDV